MSYLDRFPLTLRQALFLREFNRRKFKGSSLRELSKHLKVRWRHSNYQIIRALVKKGLLGQRPHLRGKQGSYYVTMAGKQWIKDNKEVFDGCSYSQLLRRANGSGPNAGRGLSAG